MSHTPQLLLLLLWILNVSTAQPTRLRWTLTGTGDHPPEDAVHVGRPPHGLLVCRVFHNKDILPCKVNVEGGLLGMSSTVSDGDLIKSRTFEVLTARESSVYWEPAANGDVPAGARPAGVSSTGEPLFVCRVGVQGQEMVIVGLLQPSASVCTIFHRGIKLFSTYEVLVVEN